MGAGYLGNGACSSWMCHSQRLGERVPSHTELPSGSSVISSKSSLKPGQLLCLSCHVGGTHTSTRHSIPPRINVFPPVQSVNSRESSSLSVNNAIVSSNTPPRSSFFISRGALESSLHLRALYREGEFSSWVSSDSGSRNRGFHGGRISANAQHATDSASCKSENERASFLDNGAPFQDKSSLVAVIESGTLIVKKAKEDDKSEKDKVRAYPTCFTCLLCGEYNHILFFLLCGLAMDVLKNPSSSQSGLSYMSYRFFFSLAFTSSCG